MRSRVGGFQNVRCREKLRAYTRAVRGSVPVNYLASTNHGTPGSTGETPGIVIRGGYLGGRVAILFSVITG